MTAPIRSTNGILKVGAYGGAAAVIPNALDIEIRDFITDREGTVHSSSSARVARTDDFAVDYELRFLIHAPAGALVWTYKAGDHVVAEAYSKTGVGIKGNFYVADVDRQVDITNRAYVNIRVELIGDGSAALTTP